MPSLAALQPLTQCVCTSMGTVHTLHTIGPVCQIDGTCATRRRTGADLEKHGRPGRVIAGFHSDLNFLTIHGKSRYPGLHIWLRDGTRTPVRIPGERQQTHFTSTGFWWQRRLLMSEGSATRVQ